MDEARREARSRRRSPHPPDRRERTAQTDPRAPLDSAAFLGAARPVLQRLRDDLLAQAAASNSIHRSLHSCWEAERNGRRTADPFEVWRRTFAGQVAGAWLLSMVFARTLEDRGLVTRRRIAGPGAMESHRQFLDAAPLRTVADYLLATFRDLAHLPAAAPLFDARHNRIWLLGPSPATAGALLDFFRVPDPDAPFYRFGQSDTRFLGDFYQALDGDARTRYALVQTPVHVESFILDRTLDRAIHERGIDGATFLDPACGSGHFLLGAFERLYRHLRDASAGLTPAGAARLAADAVHGVDINPYAVSIARLRLALAVLDKGGAAAAGEPLAWPLHVATADALLPPGRQPRDSDKPAREILRKRYTVVAGNPPFVTVQDSTLRERYRKLYRSAARKYSVAAPFIERFFGLSEPGGFVGMITSSSFMTRAFGRRLIEEFLPEKNIELLVNTAGAYIPGHGTPTVILCGRNEMPKGSTVQLVLAKHAEPGTPAGAHEAMVWRTIAGHCSLSDFENEHVAVTQIPRRTLSKHPVHLGGMARAALRKYLEACASLRLAGVALDMGRSTHTGEDSAFVMPAHCPSRLGIPHSRCVPLVTGEQVRDWAIAQGDVILFPYNAATGRPEPPTLEREARYYWRLRAVLQSRRDFLRTIEERGLFWFEHSRFFPKRFLCRPSIAFAEVATHNHFVLCEGGRLFKQTAPILTMPEQCPEDAVFELLAYLNSSTACFWMKQLAHRKSSASQQHHADPARAAYQFAAQLLARMPIAPKAHPLLAKAARELCDLGGKREEWLSGASLYRALAGERIALDTILQQGWKQYDEAKARSIYLQEEIDWSVYEAYELCTAQEARIDFSALCTALPGSRPFEQLQGDDAGISGRVDKTGDAFPAARRPPHWQERISLLRREGIRLIETREFKRQWRDTEQNFDQAEFRRTVEQRWLLHWVADAIEAWLSTSPAVVSESQIETALRSGTTGVTLQAFADFLGCSVRELIRRPLAAGAVPFLAALRHTESGMEKRAAWERTWQLQRRQDAGNPVAAPAPPAYELKDYRSAVCWQLRHKLDIPKERFIAYPGCESDKDASALYGWAGWDDFEQAKALATLYLQRKIEERWTRERLLPMLAGLAELMPWVMQWHPASIHQHGLHFGEDLAAFVEHECERLGAAQEELLGWRPAKARRRSGATRRGDAHPSRQAQR